MKRNTTNNWFMDLSLTTKIIISYSIIFITFFTAITFSFQRINKNYTINKIKQMSLEIAESIGKNFDTIFYTVNSQSKLLISNNMIQEILTGKNTNFDNYIKVSNYLAEFINFDSMISSIYIFDLAGNKYYIEYETPKDFSPENFKKLFDRLIELKGGYLISVNEEPDNIVEADRYISFMRVINSLDSQKPIGYLVMNISVEQIKGALSYSNNKYNTMFFLKDDCGNVIISPDSNDFENINIHDPLRIIHINKNDYVLSNAYNDFGWEIISITPINELNNQLQTYGIAIFIAVLTSGVLFILGMVIVSLMVTKPIHKLATTMSAVEKGEFKEANFRTWNDEIGKLKDVYNLVIREIKRLIDNIVEESKAKRKKELEVLQSQIKPHFLYNSFDVIRSLALSADNREIYDFVKALSKFYKGFLSYGNEIVTVKHELEIVEQYLTIQKIRYGNKFTFIKNYNNEALIYFVPRLILQPLVENAFNHGIDPLPGNGVITLEVSRTNDSVQLKVSDNGVGMSEETVKAIKEGKIQGVGLRATIERLQIFYNRPDLLNIESKEGQGTSITVTIPIAQEALDADER